MIFMKFEEIILSKWVSDMYDMDQTDMSDVEFALSIVGEKPKRVLDKTTPRLIQFHTLKNAVNPPFLGGFSIFNTVVA